MFQFIITVSGGLLGIDGESGPQAANAVLLGQSDDTAPGLGMHQDGIVGPILLENVVLHSIVSSFRFVAGGITLHEGPAEHVVYDPLLLIGQRVVDIADSLVLLGLLLGGRLLLRGLFLLSRGFLLGRLLLLAAIGMSEAQRLTSVDDGLFIALLAMSHDGVDERSGVSPGQDKAQLPDIAVGNEIALLLELVGEDRQSVDVAVLHRLLHHLAVGGVVEVAVGIHALIPLLQDGVSQNKAGIVVEVVVDKRDFLPVIVLKRTFHDGEAVRASEVSSGCPTAEITRMLHFDCFPPSMW